MTAGMVAVRDIAVRRATRRRHACAAAAAVAVVALVALGTGDGAVAETLSATLRPGKAQQIRDLGAMAVSSPVYGAPASVRRGHYPFNHTIVEPYKATNLRVGGRVGDAERLRWTVVATGAAHQEAWSALGAATTYSFAAAGRAYDVTAMDDQGNAAAARVLCKYLCRSL